MISRRRGAASDTRAQGRNRLARYELFEMWEHRDVLHTSGIADAAVALREPHGASGELALAYAQAQMLQAEHWQLTDAEGGCTALALLRSAARPIDLRRSRRYAGVARPSSSPHSSATGGRINDRKQHLRTPGIRAARSLDAFRQAHLQKRSSSRFGADGMFGVNVRRQEVTPTTR